MKKDHKELPQHIKGYLQKIDDYFEKAPFKGFLQEMDSFFHRHNVFQSIPVDLYETDTEVVVQAELPGVHKNQISVDIQDTFIKIEVTNGQTLETTSPEQSFYRKERSLLHSERTIKAPCELLKQKAKAVYQNGLLEIRVPKKPYEKQIIDID